MGAFAQWWRSKRRPSAEHADVKKSHASVTRLQAINNRLQLYLDRAPLACIVWGTDHVVRAWNPAAVAIFGYSEADAIGRHIHELVATPASMPIIDEVCPKLLAGIEYPEGVVIETRRKDDSRMQ